MHGILNPGRWSVFIVWVKITFNAEFCTFEKLSSDTAGFVLPFTLHGLGSERVKFSRYYKVLKIFYAEASNKYTKQNLSTQESLLFDNVNTIIICLFLWDVCLITIDIAMTKIHNVDRLSKSSA